MKELISITKSKNNKTIQEKLRKEFILSSSDETFKKLCNTLKLSDDILMKYTSKLENTVEELKNCKGCKNINKCPNCVQGHVYYPKVTKDFVEFNYKACKKYNDILHEQEEKKKKASKTRFFETPEVLREASLQSLINEKERTNIIKYIKEFIKAESKGEKMKGLYLSGSFGSGKSYILSALLNELSFKGYRVVNVYYPELLNRLKRAFYNKEESFDDILDEIKTCDILLLDDIGAETNTSWSRDEVLGIICQYRMNNNLTTFFTSNLSIEELSTFLKSTKQDEDELKAARIIERIKYLTVEEKLISKNKRN